MSLPRVWSGSQAGSRNASSLDSYSPVVLVSHVKRRLANAQDMDASGIAIAGLGCCRLATQYALAVFGRFPCE